MDIKSLLLKGISQKEDNKFEPAIVLFNKALSLIDHNNEEHQKIIPTIFYNLAQSYEACQSNPKNQELSFDFFEKISKMNLKDDSSMVIDSLIHLGNFHLSRFQYEKAAKAFQIAITKGCHYKPFFIASYSGFARVFLGIKQYENCVIMFNIVSRVSSNDWKLFRDRGIAYMMLGMLKESIKDFQRALKLWKSLGMKDNNFEVNFYLGIISEISGNVHAFGFYQKALQKIDDESKNRIILFIETFSGSIFEKYNFQVSKKMMKIQENEKRTSSQTQLNEINKCIENESKNIDVNNVKLSKLYCERASLHLKLNLLQCAIDDINKSTSLNDKNFEAYYVKSSIISKIFNSLNVNLLENDLKDESINVISKLNDRFKKDAENQMCLNNNMENIDWQMDMENTLKESTNETNKVTQEIDKMEMTFSLLFRDAKEKDDGMIKTVRKCSKLFNQKLKHYFVLLTYANESYDYNQGIKNEKFFFAKGIKYMSQYDYLTAMDCFSVCIELDSPTSNSTFYLYRGICYIILQLYDQAYNDFNEAYKIGAFEYRFLCAIVCEIKGDFDKAREDYTYILHKYDLLSKIKSLNKIIAFEIPSDIFHNHNIPIGTKKAITLEDILTRINEKLMKKFQNILNKKNYDESEISNTYFHRAMIYFDVMKFSKSIKDLSEFLKRNLNKQNNYNNNNDNNNNDNNNNNNNEIFYSNTEALLIRAMCFYEIKEYEKTIIDLTRIIQEEENPSKKFITMAYLLRGMAFKLIKKKGPSVADFVQMFRENEDPDFYNLMALNIHGTLIRQNNAITIDQQFFQLIEKEVTSYYELKDKEKNEFPSELLKFVIEKLDALTKLQEVSKMDTVEEMQNIFKIVLSEYRRLYYLIPKDLKVKQIINFKSLYIASLFTQAILHEYCINNNYDSALRYYKEFDTIYHEMNENAYDLSEIDITLFNEQKITEVFIKNELFAGMKEGGALVLKIQVDEGKIFSPDYLVNKERIDEKITLNKSIKNNIKNDK